MNPYGDLPTPSSAALKPNEEVPKDSPPTKKRQAPECKDEPEPKQQKAKAAMTLKAGLDRLQKHLMSEKKFEKAAKVFLKLVDDQLNSETSSEFISVLKNVIESNGDRIHDFKLKNVYMDVLLRPVLKKKESFSPSDQQLLESYEIKVITNNLLRTDDTYQFNKQAKVVESQLKCWISKPESIPPLRKEYILECLDIIFEFHTKPWAKTVSERVLFHAKASREIFSEEHRERVDGWTSGILQQNARVGSNRTVDTEKRRNIIATRANSSASGVKVGVSNHPLRKTPGNL